MRMPMNERHLSIGLASILALVVLLYFSLHDLNHWVTNDSDTLMRLSFLDWDLPRGLLTDYSFPRDGAPQGMTLHWTLPYNLFVAALAAVPALFIGWHSALGHVAILCGPLMLLADIAAAISLGSALGLKKSSGWCVAVIASGPIFLVYTEVGRAVHHPMALACVTMAMSGAVRAARAPSRQAPGTWTAFWMVLASWITMETFASLVAVWAVVLAATAIRRRQDSFRAFARSLVLFSMSAFAIDPPPVHAWALRVDRWSLFHVFAFTVMAATVYAAPYVRGRGSQFSRIARSTLPALAPGLILVLVAWRAQQDFLPDPLVHRYFLDNVSESRPAWSSIFFFALASWPTLPALAVVGLSVWKARKRPRLCVGLMVFGILACEAAVGFCFMRLSPYPALLSTVFVGSAINERLSRDSKNSPISSDIFLSGILGVVIAVACLATLRAYGEGYQHSDSCVIEEPALAVLERALPPDAIVMSDIWMSPKILWFTSLRTVSGPYHTNAAGLADVARVFSGVSPKAIHAILKRREAQAVVMCNAPAWTRSFGDRTLEHRLMLGKPVSWLTPIPVPDEPDIKLFLVR
jgi:hypothetical protein